MPYTNIEKQRLSQKLWKRQTKRWFWQLKESLECIQCGIKHPAVLQFHHRSETTKQYEISRMVNQNLNHDLILKEIAKCDVLCANCHAIWHYEDQYSHTKKESALDICRRNDVQGRLAL